MKGLSEARSERGWHCQRVCFYRVELCVQIGFFFISFFSVSICFEKFCSCQEELGVFFLLEGGILKMKGNCDSGQ